MAKVTGSSFPPVAFTKNARVSLLGLLAVIASFLFFTEANVWKTLSRAPSLIHVPGVLWLPFLNQFFRSFFPALLCFWTDVCFLSCNGHCRNVVLFLKRCNHPLEATKPSTCSFSAIT